MNDFGKNRAKAQPTMSVSGLRAEDTPFLFGTEVPQPKLSWRIESADRGVRQVSYRIRAAGSAESLLADKALLWDSGIIDSDDSLGIGYGGAPLGSMQRIWWDVEVRDNFGRTARSEPTWMESGLTSASDWCSEWIEAEDTLAAGDRMAGLTWIWSAEPLDPRLHGFRIDFTVPGDVVSLDILVAGKDQLVSVWVNGRPASLPEKIAWGTMLPVEADIRPGRNSLCVAVQAETEGFFPVDGGAMAALIRIHRPDGSIDRIVSGPQWRVEADPANGWHEAGFDASAWRVACESASRVRGDPRPPEPAMHLRKEFEARKGISRARLYATALGAYEARINGESVSDAFLAPEVSVAADHVLYQCADVTNLVGAGANVLAFTIADGFYASAFGWRMERYSFGLAPRRLRAQLRLDYPDGSTQWITTGPGWRTAESPITYAEIYGGETCDARMTSDGWDRVGFDDGHWRKAEVGTDPGGRLVAQTSPPLRNRTTVRAVTVSEPVPGRFVFDFGQNLTGWVRLNARGPSGTEISMRFAELLNADGTADQSNLRFAAARDCYVLGGDEAGETWEPRFTYHGFRFVEVRGFPGKPTADDVEAVVVYSDCRETGTMAFDEPLLGQIWRNALWSQRSNFFGVPTDCPQRDERMGWMGDIQVFLDAAAFNMDVGPFIRRFLLEARAAQREDGAYPIVVPQPQSFPEVVTAGWSEAGIILPHGLWMRYGDTAVIDDNWESMERWMAFVARDNPDGIWRHDRGLDLGDWLSVDARVPDEETTPRVLCATAYWAWCAQLMAEMAAATGRNEAAARYHALRARIGEAFASELVSPDGVAGNGSQTSQVLALYMGLVPDGLRGAAARVLVDEISARGMKLSTGFLGTPYLLDVLADAGELETVEALLLQTGYPSWGYMAVSGATTMWERWNSDVGDLAMNSYNHYAFGAVVGFFYRRLAGIAPATPGFRRISVRPVWLPRVGSVSARYDSCVGVIASRIDGDDDGIACLELTVPPNCIAEIELPAEFDWSEGDVSIGECGDILSLRAEDRRICVEVGSGCYCFTR